MIRLSRCIQFAALLLAASAVFGLPQRSEAQSGLHGVLESQLETKNFQQPMALKEALTLVQDMLKQQKLELPMLIDAETFKSDGPADAPDIYETKVQFPPFPHKMTVAAALRFILSNVVTKNATYVVLPDYILITTYDATSPERKLQEKVRGVFEKRPLNVALRELSEMVGATIVVDTRAGDKAKNVVSATFLNDIDLAGAIRVLTEMADLKAVVLDGAIFVTTPANVDALRKEHINKVTELEKLRSIREKAAAPMGLAGFGGAGLGAGGLGGLPGFPGGMAIPDPTPVVDPFWPYPSPRQGVKGAAQ